MTGWIGMRLKPAGYGGLEPRPDCEFSLTVPPILPLSWLHSGAYSFSISRQPSRCMQRSVALRINNWLPCCNLGSRSTRFIQRL